MFRPSIFISSVTGEFGAARDLVAKVLLSLGYNAVWQDVFGSESGDVRAVLRRKIDGCQAVIQLVGFRYGAEPPNVTQQGSRASYTQCEALYARERGKTVWYFIDTSLPSAAPEAPELGELQVRYRESIKAGTEFYYELDIANEDKLENVVHRIKVHLPPPPPIKRYIVTAVVLLLAILAFVFRLWVSQEAPFTEGLLAPETKLSARTGAWAWDAFVGVRVADGAVGTLIADQPYELEVELRNRTSMPLLITRTIVLSRNEEVSQLLGIGDPQVFNHEIHVTTEIGPHKTEQIPVRLNQILPAELTVRVFHNRSELPSEFNINLSAQALPMPSARHLSRNRVRNGYDILEAMRRAADDAREWSADAQIIAAIPGDHKVYIDEHSRLKYTVVNTWVMTFFSRTRNRIYMSHVSPDEVDGEIIQRPPEQSEIPLPGLKEPKIGYEQAVELADQSGLLCADWETVALRAVDVGSNGVHAWFIPYRGPSGLPLIIDATTGMQLVPAAGHGFRTLTRERRQE